MGAINLPRAAGAQSVAELGKIVDRAHDALLAQIAPALQGASSQTTEWIYLTPAGTGGVALHNGWVPFGQSSNPPRFKKANGLVVLSGLIKSGTVAGSLHGAIFFLPAGYRPAKGWLELPAASNGAYGQVDVGRWDFNAVTNTAGSSVVAAGGSNVAFSLDGICFVAEA